MDHVLPLHPAAFPAATKSSFPRKNCSACPCRHESLFGGLTPDQLAELESHKITNFYRRGQVLFYEGNVPLGLYCLTEGRVKLYKSAGNGRHKIVRLASPGDLLGYRALLAGQRYHATAEALEDSRVCFFDEQLMQSFFKRQPTVAYRLAQRVCLDFGKAEEYLFDIVNKSVPARVAGLLLSFQKQSGQPSPGGVRITLELSRSDIADWVGTTPETVIRILSRFRTRGWISVAKRDIVLKNVDALRELHEHDG